MICGKIISPTITINLDHIVPIIFLRSFLRRTKSLQRPSQPLT